MPQAADMFGLAFLTDGEREVILEVLRRDEGLRQAEEQRVEEVRKKLKEEMLDIKRKGAKRGSGRYSQRTCRRCQEALSRLTLTSRQCRACKHCVCRNCQTPQPPPAPRGSWLCCVCAKESNIKKCTLVQDWFYDQRVNRFVTTPGHDLASSSLKKRPPLKKRETMGELLLVELNPSQPAPVPRPRQKDQTMHKSHSPSEASGSVASRESYTEKEHVESKDPQQRSDTESAEKASLCSAKAETESGRVTPDLPREEKAVGRSSPAGSTASSLTTTIKPDRVSIHSDDSLANTDSEAKQVSSSFEESGMEIHKLFKKSIRHGPKPPEGSMGNRSHSVPFLDLQEEDEDIDNLVNKFHRKTVNSSTSSLASSKTTSSSMTSIYSENGDYDSVECVTGDLTFSLSYDEHTQSFNVYIKECHRLAYGDSSRKHSNPYVKCYLLPEKTRQSKKKTSTKRHTVNPIFKETLKYAISRSQLQTRSILLSVWHHSRITRNAFLGEVEVALDCHDLDSPQEQCVPLMAKGVPAQASIFAPYRGELVISLKYITPKKPTDDKSKGKKAKAEGGGGELHVWIKEAKSLTAMKSGGTSDSFVKGYLLPAKAKITKKKTPLVKKSLNPHYDHTFVYKELSLEQLRDMCLELTVWDREPLSTNDFLGGVRLSTGTGTLTTGKEEVEMDSVGEEIGLWQKMMQYPDSWAEGTLPLRSSMGKTQAK